MIAGLLLSLGLAAAAMQFLHEYYAQKPDHARVFGSAQMVLLWVYFLFKQGGAA